MNRGSPIFTAREYREDRCFNEAPIHESGKSGMVDAMISGCVKLQ